MLKYNIHSCTIIIHQAKSYHYKYKYSIAQYCHVREFYKISIFSLGIINSINMIFNNVILLETPVDIEVARGSISTKSAILVPVDGCGSRGSSRKRAPSNFPHHWLLNAYVFAKNDARFSRWGKKKIRLTAMQHVRRSWTPVTECLDEGLVLDLSPTSVRYPHYVEGHPCGFLNPAIFSLSLFRFFFARFYPANRDRTHRSCRKHVSRTSAARSWQMDRGGFECRECTDRIHRSPPDEHNYVFTYLCI